MKCSMMTVLCLLWLGQAAAQSPRLADLAERLLRSGQASGDLRLEASWLVAGQRNRAIETARELAQSKNWRLRLSALALGQQLGSQFIADDVLLKWNFLGDEIWLVRSRTLVALREMDTLPNIAQLVQIFDDPFWRVRREALALFVSRPKMLPDSALPKVVAAAQSREPSLRTTALSLLIAWSADRDEALAALGQVNWRGRQDRSFRRRACWAFLDAQAGGRGLEVLAAFSAEDTDPFARYLGIVALPASRDRTERALAFCSDPLLRDQLGGELIRALLSNAALVEGWAESTLERIYTRGARRLLAQNLRTAGLSKRFRIALAEVLIGSKKADDILLRETWEMRPPELASQLETFFVEDARAGSSRRRLRKILKFRSSLNKALPDALLLGGLKRGGFPRKVVVTEQLWRRADAGLRRTFLAYLPRLREHKAYESLIGIVAERPREEAKSFYLEALQNDGFRNSTKVTALRALLRVDDRPPFDVLRRLMAKTTSPDLRDLYLRALIDGDDEQTLADVTKRVLATPGREVDLSLLSLVSRNPKASIIVHVRGFVANGDFSTSTLGPLLNFMAATLQPEDFQKELAAFFSRALSLPKERLRHSGYESLNGIVLQHLLSTFSPHLSVSLLFDLLESGRVSEKESFLEGICDLAKSQGKVAELEPILIRRWQAIEGLAKAMEARADLVASMLSLGTEDARRRVTSWTMQVLGQLHAGKLEREKGWYGAVVLDRVLWGLVAEGSRDSLRAAVLILIDLEKRQLRRSLAGALKTTARSDQDITVQERFHIGAFTSVGGRPDVVRRLEKIWTDTLGHEDERILVRGFWRDWARQYLRFPAAGEPSSFIATGLLGAGSLAGLKPSLLMKLGRRVFEWNELPIGARLYLRGRQEHDLGQITRHKAEQQFTDFGRVSTNDSFWTAKRARVSLGWDSTSVEAYWSHRFHEEQSAKYVEFLYRRGDIDEARSLVAYWRERSFSFGIWAAIEARFLLDAKFFREVRRLARSELGRVAIFGGSEGLGHRTSWLCFEAAGCWGQGDHQQARLLLKKAGVRQLNELQGPVAKDFKGF